MLQKHSRRSRDPRGAMSRQQTLAGGDPTRTRAEALDSTTQAR